MPSSVANDDVPAVRQSTRTSFCCVFYNIGSAIKVGLRNTCDQCKICSINFNDPDGTSTVKNFTVQAHTSIIVDISGTTSTQIIDEQNCKAESEGAEITKLGNWASGAMQGSLYSNQATILDLLSKSSDAGSAKVLFDGTWSYVFYPQ